MKAMFATCTLLLTSFSPEPTTPSACPATP